MQVLEEVIGYKFRDHRLLAEALTRRSHAEERGATADNERLEFLGDSILGMVVACHLFRTNPDWDEGVLSKHKAAVVSRANLARWAAAINLGSHLRLGTTEEVTGSKDRQSTLANAVEAVLGAIYLDGGIEPVERIVRGWLTAQPQESPDSDYKSELQVFIQKKRQDLPAYEVEEEAGPEHLKRFTVRACYGGVTLGLGAGASKKEAQQAAAKNALEYLKSHKLPKAQGKK